MMVEKVPDIQTAEAAQEKKKKKKKPDIYDMFDFDVEKVEKVTAKAVKKKKSESGSRSNKITLNHLEKTMAAMAKLGGGEETEEQNKEPQKTEEKDKFFDDHLSLLCFPSDEEMGRPPKSTKSPKAGAKVEEKEQALLRFPSPSRSRQGSPKKERDESPKKTSMKASAAEFVPPGIASPAKETSSSAMKASAAEFVPPGFSSPAKTTSSLQANAVEFVPPGFESKADSKAVAEPILDVTPPKPKVVMPPKSEPLSEAGFKHALFTPTAEITQASKVPTLTLKTGEQSKSADEDKALDADDSILSARLDGHGIGNILNKVKQSLFFSNLSRLAPGAANGSIDPCKGKVAEKVRKIEEKEADNEAEKQREAAIKAVQEKAAQEKKLVDEANEKSIKKAQRDMDETLMDCFLQAVKTRVKDRELPIMGTTLYGKYMRASRRIGTSCDVKDSSFVWLRPFLESLEDENLLTLNPESKDPKVTWINRDHHLIKNWHSWSFNQTVGSQKACGPTTRR